MNAFRLRQTHCPFNILAGGVINIEYTPDFIIPVCFILSLFRQTDSFLSHLKWAARLLNQLDWQTGYSEMRKVVRFGFLSLAND